MALVIRAVVVVVPRTVVVVIVVFLVFEQWPHRGQ